MSDLVARPWQDLQFWAEPGADDVREARHVVLADLLAAYVDDELTSDTASQLDAHLVGCARCRRDVRLQVAVRGALASTAGATTADVAALVVGVPCAVPAPDDAPRTSAALRARVVAIAAAPMMPVIPVLPVTPALHREEPSRRDIALRATRVAALGVLALAVVWQIGRLAVLPTAVETIAAPAAGVPLLGAALADYRRVVVGDLPTRAAAGAADLVAVRAASGVAVEPLHADGLRLLGAWTTELAGAPAAALAYRWKDRLLVQYIVPDSPFFRSAAMRDAAAAHRRLVLDDGSQGVVAWPVVDAGSILIGEGGAGLVAEPLSP